MIVQHFHLPGWNFGVLKRSLTPSSSAEVHCNVIGICLINEWSMNGCCGCASQMKKSTASLSNLRDGKWKNENTLDYYFITQDTRGFCRRGGRLHLWVKLPCQTSCCRIWSKHVTWIFCEHISLWHKAKWLSVQIMLWLFPLKKNLNWKLLIKLTFNHQFEVFKLLKKKS